MNDNIIMLDQSTNRRQCIAIRNMSADLMRKAVANGNTTYAAIAAANIRRLTIGDQFYGCQADAIRILRRALDRV